MDTFEMQTWLVNEQTAFAATSVYDGASELHVTEVAVSFMLDSLTVDYLDCDSTQSAAAMGCGDPETCAKYAGVRI
jgi:hypothetical protein